MQGRRTFYPLPDPLPELGVKMLGSIGDPEKNKGGACYHLSNNAAKNNIFCFSTFTRYCGQKCMADVEIGENVKQP